MSSLRKAIALILICLSWRASAQRMLTDMMDTTTDLGKGMLSLYERYNQLRFSVYLQPQFQYTTEKGAKSFEGGDFAPESNNRFTLRRGRFKMEYVRLAEQGNFPKVQAVFQFDATERGVFVRDAWGRLFENKWHLFSIMGGIFARPFGYELNTGSADRESPERGRMSQLLMRIERDMGAMIILEPRDRGPHWLRFDLGLFNGQGLTGTADYDSHKDIISRLWCKGYNLPRLNWRISGGVSGYYGGIVSQTNVRYREAEVTGMPSMLRDSSASNHGFLAPRRYAGADVQLRIPNKKGFSEFRAEYIRGQQTGTAATSESPGTYPVSGPGLAPLYTRSFDGAYFYYLQHLGSTKHQLVVKYDWYDPNRKAEGKQLTAANGFTGADVRYNTLNVGYNYYMNPNIKLMLHYAHVTNEETALAGIGKDLDDDVLTFRMQFRF